MPESVLVPGDRIEETFADLPVRPESSDPDANARALTLREDEDASLEILGSLRIDENAAVMLSLRADWHVQFGKGGKYGKARAFRTDPEVPAP
jgi:hypothetical protein